MARRERARRPQHNTGPGKPAVAEAPNTPRPWWRRPSRWGVLVAAACAVVGIALLGIELLDGNQTPQRPIAEPAPTGPGVNGSGQVSRPLPRGLVALGAARAAPNASGTEIWSVEEGWFLLAPGAPAVVIGGQRIDIGEGQALAGTGAAAAAMEPDGLIALLEESFITVTEKENEAMKNPRNWMRAGTFALCVLSGAVMVNGQTLKADDAPSFKVEPGRGIDPALDKALNVIVDGVKGIITEAEKARAEEKRLLDLPVLMDHDKMNILIQRDIIAECDQTAKQLDDLRSGFHSVVTARDASVKAADAFLANVLADYDKLASALNEKVDTLMKRMNVLEQLGAHFENPAKNPRPAGTDDIPNKQELNNARVTLKQEIAACEKDAKTNRRIAKIVGSARAPLNVRGKNTDQPGWSGTGAKD